MIGYEVGWVFFFQNGNGNGWVNKPLFHCTIHAIHGRGFSAGAPSHTWNEPASCKNRMLTQLAACVCVCVYFYDKSASVTLNLRCLCRLRTLHRYKQVPSLCVWVKCICLVHLPDIWILTLCLLFWILHIVFIVLICCFSLRVGVWCFSYVLLLFLWKPSLYLHQQYLLYR